MPPACVFVASLFFLVDSIGLCTGPSDYLDPPFEVLLTVLDVCSSFQRRRLFRASFFVVRVLRIEA